METAKTSEGDYARNYKVGAVLFNRKGIVLERRTNVLKTHTTLHSFSDYPYLHAESYCLISHGLNRCTEDLKLLVVRVRKPNDQLTMAKPCTVCQKFIKKTTKINQVFYSNWNGEIECLSL